MSNIIKNKLRQFALRKRQKQFNKLNISPKKVSILSSNCWGGQLYHDANMMFLSPTINLTFEPNDFLIFVNKINEIKTATIVEKQNCKPYPVGLITYSDGSQITIYFVHYKTFNDAKNAFLKRSARICKNIVVLLMVNKLEESVIENFKSIPYKKKCIYGQTKCDVQSDHDFIKFELITKSKKDILSFKSYFTGERLIDSVGFDYYRFIFTD